MKVGYARVSSTGQNLESQIEALTAFGCEKIFEEKKSGTSMTKRLVLEEAIEFCREGDSFIVTRLDRCSRSVSDLQNIVSRLDAKNVSFICTEQSEVNTTTSNGKLMLNLLSAFAQFETELRAERQADGIASAKKRGIKFGKKKANLSDEDLERAIKMQDEGITGATIAKEFGVARSTLLKYIKQYKESRSL